VRCDMTNSGVEATKSTLSRGVRRSHRLLQIQFGSLFAYAKTNDVACSQSPCKFDRGSTFWICQGAEH
jgi:hypothetical protein